MGVEETRHDLWMKRIHTWIGILGGSIASLAAAYNFVPFFVAAAPGDIAAVVREQSGSPVTRARVELLTSQNLLLSTSETDRNGRYVKKDLPPGSYILKVRRGSLEPQVAVVNVTSKNTTDLDLILKNPRHVQAATIPHAASTSLTQGNTIRSALEETGAAWVKSLANSAR
jgi:carboxypeptidase family protein